MIRVLSALLVLLGLTPGAAVAASCAGANPAITSVTVKNVTTSGQLNTYHLAGTVTNLGSQGQPSNTLQFVDIYVDQMKKNDRGIPPLAPGQSYTFGFDWPRSSDAGSGTTTVHFRVRMVQGSDCNPANGTNSVTF
ncbi:MAG TPA: CARDB domain-containing protein [Candidatus Cybelea sp.]|nr:CARDB domain-containing protein [Candidatus Cybelea sp.]